MEDIDIDAIFDDLGTDADPPQLQPYVPPPQPKIEPPQLEMKTSEPPQLEMKTSEAQLEAKMPEPVERNGALGERIGSHSGMKIGTCDAGNSAASKPTVEPPPACPSWLACLRERIVAFYAMAGSEKTDEQLDMILQKFRYRTPELWAQLCMKYKIPATKGIECMATTLHPSFPFEMLDEQAALEMDGELHKIQACDRAYLFNHFLGTNKEIVRQLALRGVPDALRKDVWSELLGLSDADTNSDLYKVYSNELLPPQNPEHQSLYDEIRRDTLRTQPDVSFFTEEKKDAVLRIMYIYARLNPGVRYVQGMNELSAPLLYVFEEESEAFWGFTNLMGYLKDSFMVSLDDDSACGVHAELNRFDHILRMYDPELSAHLVNLELPTALYGLRWVTTWLAQDTHLLDCLRLWDSFLAAREMILFACASIMFMIRDDLLDCTDFSQLVTMLQEAPKGVLSRNVDLFQGYAFALLAFKERNARSHWRFPPVETSGGEVVDRLQQDFKHMKKAVARFTESDDVQHALQSVTATLASAREIASEKTESWLHDTQPHRQDAMQAATETFGLLWGGVRSAAQAAQRASTSDTAKSGLNWLRSMVEEYSDEEPTSEPPLTTTVTTTQKKAFVEVEDEKCDWE